MLQSLSLINFQAHRRLEVDLDPHVTVFVGPSDSGKSAVIRALWWVLANKPAGDAFVRKGSKGTKVDLVVDGVTVSRVRRGAENAYRIDDRELKAFGASAPPDEVVKLLKVGDLNFQSQHAAPFWFSETAGEVSRQLNQIVDLGTIDDVLAHTASTLRRCKERVDIALENQRACKQRVEALHFVEALESMLGAVKAQAASSQVFRRRAEVLRVLVLQISIAHKHAQAIAKQAKQAGELRTFGERAFKARSRVQEIVKNLQLIETLKSRQFRAPDLAPLARTFPVAQNKRNDAALLAKHLVLLRDLHKNHTLARDAAREAGETLEKQCEGRCPVCGGKLK